jgi:hypothetical protein
LGAGAGWGSEPTAIYPVTFGVSFAAGRSDTPVWIEVTQDQLVLEEVRLRAPEARYKQFTGDGEIRRVGDRVVWQPPPEGGRLNYVVSVDHQRNGKGYDAIVRSDFALLRADDLFPPASIRQMDGSESASRLVAELPAGWRLVTPFPSDEAGGWQVVNPRRKFDRPTGWLVAGELGIRRDEIAGISVSVAGPRHQGVQRISMLALLRWTLPDVLALAPGELPDRLSIVSGGDPLWRGGLSGPGSLYIHAERPLLSEDGTSTLLHEAIHVLLPIHTAPKADWIDEGAAEYLTLAILRDTGSISRARYKAAIRGFRQRGKAVTTLDARYSSGNRTARAVVLFHDLDRELKAATDGRTGAPALIARLCADHDVVDGARLAAVARELAPGASLRSLNAIDR